MSALSNVIQANVVAHPRERIVTAAASGTPVNLAQVSISAILSSVPGTATATSAGHGFQPGDQVTISGATPSAFNGTFEVLTVPNTSTFTFRIDPVYHLVAVTGTLVGIGKVRFRRAIVIGNKAARTGNTGTVYLGMSPTNDTQFLAIATGAKQELVCPDGACFDLSDFWLDVATNADGVAILFW